MNPDRTILEEAKFVGPVDETWARMALGALLLRRDKVQDRVGVLSMGERGRVALAKLLLSGVNMLVLDEPTNHLDIDARIALEKALENYPGTILFISHDRRFIEYLADTILMIKKAVFGIIQVRILRICGSGMKRKKIYYNNGAVYSSNSQFMYLVSPTSLVYQVILSEPMRDIQILS